MKNLINFIRSTFQVPKDFIPLHDPRFIGNEVKYMQECIESNFVSSVGEFVGRFEKMCAEYTGAQYAVAAMNGTSALHIALQLSGVQRDDEVITQALTFIATANAISYTGAHPVFLDVDKETMGLSPSAVEAWLAENVEMREVPIANSQQISALSSQLTANSSQLSASSQQSVVDSRQLTAIPTTNTPTAAYPLASPCTPLDIR